MGGISTQRADTGRGSLELSVVQSFCPCRRVDSLLFWLMIAENVPRQRRPREVRQKARAPPRHQAAAESHLDLSRYLHASSGPPAKVSQLVPDLIVPCVVRRSQACGSITRDL